MGSVLRGLRVIDLSQGFAGPLAGMILADNGADVIKIEPPGGDWARREPGFLMWNRGKKSVVLDLNQQTHRSELEELASRADVLLETFRPGVLERLGIAYERLRDSNKQLVFCSISGFGPATQLSHVKGYEGVVAAKAGLMLNLDEVTGAAVGQARDRPIYKAIMVNSYASAQLAVQAIVAALLEREASGEGQRIGTSLLQGAAATVMRRAFSRDGDIRVSRLDGKTNPMYRGVSLTFLTAECRDGKWIQMCARQDRHFQNWMRALDLEAVLDDPRYSGGPTRIPTIADVEELELRIRRKMRERPQSEWMRVFIAHDVGADPFLTREEFFEHPQMTRNQRVVSIEDPTVGPTKQIGPLVLFSETAAVPRLAAPRLNEHASVLRDLLSEPTRTSSARLSSSGGSRRPPLAGLTLLELAYFVAAPVAGTVLAELGARVIKVEPLTGDPYRNIGLEFVHTSHGKESIAVDLKQESGRAVLHRLIARADAMYHNFRPGTPERLGFGYRTAASINDAIVYLYAAGYGSQGPEAARPAFHSTPNALSSAGIIQAGSGNPPVDDCYSDPCSGLAAATALALGLLARKRTGRGQYLETTMLCSTAYAVSPDLILYDGVAAPRIPDGKQQGLNALYRLYECHDGWLFLGVTQDKEWTALARALDHSDWLEDPRFVDRTARLANDPALSDQLRCIFTSRPACSWEQELLPLDIPAVQADGAVFPEFLHSLGLLREAEEPTLGRYWRLPLKYQFSESALRTAPAAGIGEHTRPLLAELGYRPGEVEALFDRGIVK